MRSMYEFEADQSAAYGGPAIGAWPRNKGERLRPHKGGGGDPGADARRQEAERQARIKAATETINAVFNNQQKVTKTRVIPASTRQEGIYEQDEGNGRQIVGYRDVTDPQRTETYEEWESGDPTKSRDAMYQNQRSAVYDLNKMEVDRQAQEAERANRFGLARSGLLGGSVNVDSQADLDRRTNEGLMRAGGIADQASADLKTADERTRSSLISLAQSGIDTGTAAQQSLKGLEVNAANAAGARAGSTVGRLFDDMSQAYLVNQTNQGRAAGMNPYANQFSVVSNPRTTYAGT